MAKKRKGNKNTIGGILNQFKPNKVLKSKKK
jgi:hypothetical protein